MLAKPLRLLIIGMAGHGKDTVAEILATLLGQKAISSSLYVAEKIMLPAFKEVGIPYSNATACYNNRNDWRDFWHDEIHKYNSEDKARLGRELFSEYDIYIGLRNRLEFNAIRDEQLYDLCIWVDATERLGVTETTSIQLTKEDADLVIFNNDDEDDLGKKLARLANVIKGKYNGNK